MLLFCKKADFISINEQKTHVLLLLPLGEPREISWLYSWNLLSINPAFASGMPFPLFRRNLLKDYKLFLIITYIINILLLPFVQFVWFGIGSFKFRKIHIWWDGQHFIRKLCPCINSFPIKIHKGITTYWMLHQSKQLFDIIPALEPTCALAKIWSYRFKFNRILYFGMHMKVINIITLSYFLWNILAIDLLLLLFFCFIFIFNAK